MKKEGIVRTKKVMRVMLKKERQMKVGPGPGYSNNVRKTNSLTPIAMKSKINFHTTIGALLAVASGDLTTPGS